MKLYLTPLACALAVCVISLALSEGGRGETAKPVTNSDVIQMVKAGLKDSVIMKAIDANGADLDVSPSGLMELRKARVSQRLIEAMIDYSQRNHSSPAAFTCGPAAVSPREGVSSPQLIFKAEPEYTEKARKSKVQGTVALKVCVQKDGNVGAVGVARSLEPGLDEEAIKAVKQWRFRPATSNGNPVDFEADIQVTFRLFRGG